jgi:hypothetical protein
MSGLSSEDTIHIMNTAVFTEEDRRARELWESTGTVELDYLRSVLGNPTETVSPQVLPKVRILTKEDLLKMECPYPPETGYDEKHR